MSNQPLLLVHPLRSFCYRIRPCWAKLCSVSTHPAKKARIWTLRSSRGWWLQLAPLPSCALTTLSTLRSPSCPRWKQVNLAYVVVVLKSAWYIFYTLSPSSCCLWPPPDCILWAGFYSLSSYLVGLLTFRLYHLSKYSFQCLPFGKSWVYLVLWMSDVICLWSNYLLRIFRAKLSLGPGCFKVIGSILAFMLFFCQCFINMCSGLSRASFCFLFSPHVGWVPNLFCLIEYSLLMPLRFY